MIERILGSLSYTEAHYLDLTKFRYFVKHAKKFGNFFKRFFNI